MRTDRKGRKPDRFLVLPAHLHPEHLDKRRPPSVRRYVATTEGGQDVALVVTEQTAREIASEGLYVRASLRRGA